jgi:hypothetical protein
MDENEPYPSTYLGDGVYASFDGYSVWLAVNHHENNVVALEPQVLAHLVQYIESLKEQNA